MDWQCLRVGLCSSVLLLGVWGCDKAKATEAPPAPPDAKSAAPASPSTQPTVAVLAPAAVTPAAQPDPQKITPRVVAIFMKNKAGASLDDRIGSAEELITARVGEKGFSVISREDVLNTVASFAGGGANKGDGSNSGARRDGALSEEASALRLIQNMRAEYGLVVTFISYNQTQKKVEAYGVTRVQQKALLRVSYKLIENESGSSVAGGVLPDITRNVTTVDQADCLDDLLNDASIRLAEALEAGNVQAKLRAAGKSPDLAAATFICGAAETAIPDVVQNARGEWVLSSVPCPVQTMNVNIKLDGFDIGTAPGTYVIAKGAHKVRLTRAGYKDYEGSILAAGNQTFKIDLEMTPEKYANWKETTKFLQDLKAGQKLSDAQAEAVRGAAQMLRQSGLKADIKIDSDGKGLIQPSLWNWK